MPPLKHNRVLRGGSPFVPGRRRAFCNAARLLCVYAACGSGAWLGLQGTMGCAVPKADPGATPSAHAACANDRDCDSGFCDLGHCQPPLQAFGQSCSSVATPEGLVDAKLSPCGAYVCNAGKCRSCSGDVECQEKLGAARCYELPGKPGRRCGNP